MTNTQKTSETNKQINNANQPNQKTNPVRRVFSLDSFALFIGFYARSGSDLTESVAFSGRCKQDGKEQSNVSPLKHAVVQHQPKWDLITEFALFSLKEMLNLCLGNCNESPLNAAVTPVLNCPSHQKFFADIFTESSAKLNSQSRSIELQAQD